MLKEWKTRYPIGMKLLFCAALVFMLAAFRGNTKLRAEDGSKLVSSGCSPLHSSADSSPSPTQTAGACPIQEVEMGVIGGDFAQNSQNLIGIADLHSHPFAYEGFGGLLMHGRAFHREGIAMALHSCQESHGVMGVGDIIGNGLDGTIGHSTAGYPHLLSWPAWNESNHQQMYYRWLERAFRGGLRLLVAHAVNSEALCRLAAQQAGYSCNDMEAVDRQIAAAYAMVDFVDAQHGGQGKGWLTIVRSSQDAREAISAGKLAMVLGIEVDSLFNCKPGACDEETIKTQLDAYAAKGVRHFLPIHVTDNAFGGAALYTPYIFNLANKVQNGSFFQVEDCLGKGYTYQEGRPSPKVLQSMLPTPNSIFPDYPKLGAYCNARGLTPLGESLLKEMMSRKLLIDVDHMSAKTLDAALSLAEQHRYPLISGHTGFVETSAPGQKRSEAQKTDQQLKRLIRLGSIVGPILQQGKAQSEVLSHGPVANDCDASAKSWAQAYAYVLESFAAEGREPAVAYGSDFNGMIHMPAPRFGKEACAGNKAQAKLQMTPVVYPFHSERMRADFERIKTGHRTHDYNYDGFGHIGLLPDFIQELEGIGLPQEKIDPLFHSAEAYIRMWEAAESTSF